MIYEVTTIHIHPGQQADFEAAIKQGADTIIAKSKGFLGYSVRRAIESPEQYQLQIKWETLEDHMVGFRESPAFPAWRAIISPFFASAPTTVHVEEVSRG
ncbi:antibiotic biosynthesis monooxygenase family protein [Kerstersia gyiorum]|jgi:heme-degrading monooxygenase HmoA|uniref:Antibiotic biosynthesis monooxygenase n=1 Tax=Kerstersia gyiorum TaxID=206506 RepID=A0A171KUQ5_9BURK|nr:antibiotic biosynthesis monooxygenase family protein [Kerstersia gyiorum]AZV93211.1 antibiotic biosynthesis monooxygenase [Bordetella sp. J329]MCO7642768.1 antibiotic biosynthesis monooxygenase [Pseudomonas sp. S 311-6]KAB0543586.1 antibiotic biosynthesis monooxygenase [Kerstersia gyiorum]KKO72622.1 antibiotic biosynthesis monooxygenase [Kerstersia gyiorum]MCH4272180.1 antibiotic biosynthesis monooxygenase [Kerstersia gyiorum]